MAGMKTAEVVEIRPVDLAVAEIKIVGDSPLIMHAWSAKAKREMLEKQIGVTKTKARDKKVPLEDFVSSMYWLTPMPTEFTEEAVGAALEGARFGFPVTGFKQAALSAAYRNGWSKDKMSLRGTFFIRPDADGYYSGDMQIDWARKKIDITPNIFRTDALVEIHSDTPVMREDLVKVGMGTADIRYRGQFDNWWAVLKIQYDRNSRVSLDMIVNMINAGGFCCGVGEWRVERDGVYGSYHVSAA